MNYEIPPQIEEQILAVSKASGFDVEMVCGDAILLGLTYQSLAALLNQPSDEFLILIAATHDAHDIARMKRVRDGVDKLLKYIEARPSSVVDSWPSAGEA